MKEGLDAPDLRGLNDSYEIVGELRGSAAAPTYIGRPRDGSAEVAITVARAPKGGEGNELSHYAADTQILESITHPSLARVLDGRWVGNDAYAIVTERIQGETLAERLDRGERFGNPGIALLLQDVSRVLDWARDHGVVHRLVTPDTVFFERDTNRVRMSFTPRAIPITGVPNACGDMQTLGMLAWAMLTGAPYDAQTAAKSLGEANPNLAARVVEATDKAIRCKDGEAANPAAVSTFLGIIASGDVLKQAEVEIAALKEEYDEEHRRELLKCENQRQEVEQHAAEQAAMLAGEREEFAKHMSDERAAMAAERAEFERVMSERKDRLAAVRTELDQQRAEMEKRLADLEAYRVEVEKARDAAIAVAEQARRDAIEAADQWRKEALAASAAAAEAATAAAAAAAKDAKEAAAAQAAANTNAARVTATPPATPNVPAPKVTQTPAKGFAAVSAELRERMSAEIKNRMASLAKPVGPAIPPAPPRVSVPKVAMPTPPKALKEMKAPKWDKQMQPLDATDEELIAATAGRPRWMIPAGVATLAIIIVAVVFSLTHRAAPSGQAVRVGNTVVAPTAADSAAGLIPRGGFLTQPPAAGGAAASAPVQTSPIVADTANAATDSAAGAVIPILGAPEPDSAAPPAPPARPTASTHATPVAPAGTVNTAAHPTARSMTSTPSTSSNDSAPRTGSASSNSSTSSAATTPSGASTPRPATTGAKPDSTPRADTASTGSRIDSAMRGARARLDSMMAKLMHRSDSVPKPVVTPAGPDTTRRLPPPPPDTLVTA